MSRRGKDPGMHGPLQLSGLGRAVRHRAGSAHRANRGRARLGRRRTAEGRFWQSGHSADLRCRLRREAEFIEAKDHNRTGERLGIVGAGDSQEDINIQWGCVLRVSQQAGDAQSSTEMPKSLLTTAAAAAIAFNSRSSRQSGVTICNPTGSPSANPHGNVPAGWPVRLNG
jgi:hypothetical protein